MKDTIPSKYEYYRKVIILIKTTKQIENIDSNNVLNAQIFYMNYVDLLFIKHHIIENSYIVFDIGKKKINCLYILHHTVNFSNSLQAVSNFSGLFWLASLMPYFNNYSRKFQQLLRKPSSTFFQLYKICLRFFLG